MTTSGTACELTFGPDDQSSAQALLKGQLGVCGKINLYHLHRQNKVFTIAFA